MTKRMTGKKFRVDFLDMIDGWGRTGWYGEFDTLEDAVKKAKKYQSELEEGNKRAGEHYGVIDMDRGFEVWCGADEESRKKGKEAAREATATEALKSLIELVKNGKSVLITPDEDPGSVYELNIMDQDGTTVHTHCSYHDADDEMALESLIAHLQMKGGLSWVADTATICGKCLDKGFECSEVLKMMGLLSKEKCDCECHKEKTDPVLVVKED